MQQQLIDNNKQYSRDSYAKTRVYIYCFDALRCYSITVATNLLCFLRALLISIRYTTIKLLILWCMDRLHAAKESQPPLLHSRAG